MDKNVKKEVSEEKSSISYLDKLLIFWNKDIKKKFIIICIISVILIVLLTNFMYSVYRAEIISNSGLLEAGNNTIVQNSFTNIFKSKLIMLGLTLVAGVVPYFFIPVIGMIGYVFTTASEISIKILGIGSIGFNIFTLISTIFDVLVISITTSIAIYFADRSTKRYRYSSIKRFTFLDLKLQTYEIMKKEDKVEITKKQIEKRNEKHEKNNVEIKYLEMLGIFGIAVVIQGISVLIEILTR